MTAPLARPASDRRWALLAVTVGLPVLALVVVLSQRNWFPTGDLAQAELRLRSLPQRPPLLGAAGRIMDDAGRQGNHPGPLMFWAMWPFYVVLGRSAWAFEAAAALVNLTWLTLSIWLVHRRAGVSVAAWYSLTTLVLIGGYGLDGLTQPWNPWMALIPFTVTILAAWWAVEGSRWTPALAVFSGSFAIQSHLGYGPVVAPVVLVALVAPVVHHIRRNRSGPDAGPNVESGDAEPVGRGPASGSVSHWLLPAVVAVLVGLAAWSGPLVDLVHNDPNNVTKLIDNFGSPDEEAIGPRRAVEAMLQSLSPWGAWVRGGEEVTGSILPGLALLAAWAGVAVAVARKREHRSVTVLNAIVAITLLFGTFAVARIFGALYLYVFRWIAPLTALVVFTSGWGIALLLPRPTDEQRRRLAGIAVVGLVAMSVFTTQRVVREEIPYDQSWRMESVLAPETIEQLDPSKRYLVRWDDPAYLGGLGFGLILELEREGFVVGADPRFRAAVEPHRVMCAGDYDAVLTTVTGRTALARWAAKEDAVVLSETDLDGRTGSYDERLDRLRVALAEQGQELTIEEIENRMNLILLSPGQPRSVADPAAEVVLGGVPSAVYLQDPAPREPPRLPSAIDAPCA